MLSLRSQIWLPSLVLVVGLLTSACSNQDVTPAGGISGAMPPLAGVGSLLSVTATAADGTVYTSALNAQTGTFSFSALPPGTYVVKFSTTAAKNFPYWVTTTVVAGATATPQIPPITHDNIGRGTMKWTLNSKSYAATEFIKVYGQGDYFTLWGRNGTIGAGTEVTEVSVNVPKENENGKLFAGANSYPLGGAGRVTPSGLYGSYFGGDPNISVYYTTVPFGLPTGALHLTSYDAERGVAVGTFEFAASWSTATSNYPNVLSQATVTQGEFNITF